jgi:hypothetical protein
LDLTALPKEKVGVVAAACRVSSEVVTANAIKIHADRLQNTQGVLLLALPTAPKQVNLNGTALAADGFEFDNGSLRIRFANSAAGIDLAVTR